MEDRQIAVLLFLSFLRKQESRDTIMSAAYVYAMASKRNGTLYIGVTSDLIKRVYEHKNNLRDGFTKKYNVHLLVWFEVHEDIRETILRERQIKKWKRAWKIELIETENSQWFDLYDDLIN